MKVAVVGSRGYKGLFLVDVFLAWLGSVSPEPLVIISGGAAGVDQRAREAAQGYRMAYKEYPADWDKHGRAAGYIRNEEMVKEADLVVAFWDGQSRGTKHSIDLALKHGKMLRVYFDKITPFPGL